MEKRIPDIVDKIEEIDTSVKENVKSKMFLSQNIQEICKVMKIIHPKLIRIEESQLKDPENIFNKVIEENFTNLRKRSL